MKTLPLWKAAVCCVLAGLFNLLADRYVHAFLPHAIVSVICAVVMFVCLRPVLNFLFKMNI